MPRCGDNHVGRSALHHKLLRPVEDEAVALPPCFQRGLLRRVTRPFVDREREYRVSGENAGIPTVGVLRPFDRTGRDDRGLQERRRSEVAADLLEHQRRLGCAEPKPAMAFGDADAGEPKLAELLPQIVPETVAAADVPP